MFWRDALATLLPRPDSVITVVVMSGTDLARLDRDALIALVLKLAAGVEALKRSGRRQAAPFSKGTRVNDPERPGRKPGQGPFQRRQAPDPESLSEPPIDVPAAETDCPRCGGELGDDRVQAAWIVDLPEVVRPRVRLFRVAVGRCRRCGATARGRHPDLAHDQRGATAHRLGPRLLAAAHQLHYGLGVPVRKRPERSGRRIKPCATRSAGPPTSTPTTPAGVRGARRPG